MYMGIYETHKEQQSDMFSNPPLVSLQFFLSGVLAASTITMPDTSKLAAYDSTEN